ncbi:MAG: HypC/HybG/HupF family hydrogenase formation chaperone [Myxococcaceae bacterium]|nr:HypC/HybG/HupF family hydrogenase formation chaperone [Myxococcaceae bacterium]
MCLGIPGEVMSRRTQDGLGFATVRFGSIEREVCLECLPDVKVGDFVLVHVGFAISRLDEEEARRTLAALAELGLDRAELGLDPAPSVAEKEDAA